MLLPLLQIQTCFLACLLFSFYYKLSDTVFKLIGLFSSLIVFFYSLFLWSVFKLTLKSQGLASFTGFFESYPFLISYNDLTLDLSLDSISLFFILLSSFIFLICFVSTWRKTGNVFSFVFLFLILEIFIIFFFLAADLLSFYIFFEAVLIPMFLIIGSWGSGRERIFASYYLLMYTVLSSAIMIYAIGSIYLATSTTNFFVLSNIYFSPSTQIIFFLCFFVGFAVKVPLFPFHLWLPEAHVQAPTEGSVILAALLLKMGVYGILRVCFNFFPYGSIYFGPIIRCLAVFGVLYASLVAINQTDLKRIIAYSSVAHMNLVIAGMFSFSYEGLQGAIFLSLAHGITSSALFFLVGFLYDRHSSRQIFCYGGLVNVMPLFCSFFFFFLLANISMPGTSNFVGELITLFSIFLNNPFLCFLTCFGIVLSAVYSMWLFVRISFGSLKLFFFIDTMDLTKVEFCILFPFVILTIYLGCIPSFILNTLSYDINFLISEF